MKKLIGWGLGIVLVGALLLVQRHYYQKKLAAMADAEIQSIEAVYAILCVKTVMEIAEAMHLQVQDPKALESTCIRKAQEFVAPEDNRRTGNL